jgi:hypothetical protein
MVAERSKRLWYARWLERSAVAGQLSEGDICLRERKVWME